MCLLLLAHRPRPDLTLVLAANRDEFYDRPSAPSAWWEDSPGILAGRDLRQGGTWLGVSRRGRLAALTNIREPSRHDPAAPSRGLLVKEFLRSPLDAGAFLRKLDGSPYNGFNLLAFDGENLAVASNRAEGVRLLEPGLHGFSNGLLDSPRWPKVRRGMAALGRLLEAADGNLEEGLLAVLADGTPAPDGELPRTGIGLEAERALSPIFTRTEVYGTRASTVVILRADGGVSWVERAYGPSGRPGPEVRVCFRREVP
ncbi:MAG: NRDE family protein [Acidobacteriota bacterium]